MTFIDKGEFEAMKTLIVVEKLWPLTRVQWPKNRSGRSGFGRYTFWP